MTGPAQGGDLAQRLGQNNVVLMRGHGFAAARSLIEVVRMSVYTPRNARALPSALTLGRVKPLSRGEIDARNAGYKPRSPETHRAWEYWARRAGCGNLRVRVGISVTDGPTPQRGVAASIRQCSDVGRWHACCVRGPSMYRAARVCQGD